MSDTRDAIWTYINAYYKEHRYMPTTKEIAVYVGRHVNTVQSHMRHLVDEGLIETDEPITNLDGEKTKTAWASRGYRFGKC